jgi:hypothetical protein
VAINRRREPTATRPAANHRRSSSTKTYVGRTIIIGLTYLDHAGNLVEQRQLHGEVISAYRKGIVIALAGKYAGQTWNMPPALESIRGAPAGEYRFRETGEVVVDPDLMATWTITAPPQN